MGGFSPSAIAFKLWKAGVGYDEAYAFDPGDSTGLCSIDARLTGTASIVCSTLSQRDLFDTLKMPVISCRAVVFYEGFVSRPGVFARTQLAPQNVGAIKYWAHARGMLAIEIQPSQTHRLSREDVRAAGWSWSTEHEFDAIRILIMGVLALSQR